MSDIKIEGHGDDTDIDIDLGLPLQYLKHFPQSFGEIIQIQLQLEADKDRVIHKEVRQGNELQSPAGKDPLLIYVTYEEGVPGGPYLTMRFVKPVRFRVAQKSLTTLSITVIGEPQKEAKQEEKPLHLEAAPGDEPITQQEEPVKSEKPRDNIGQLMAKARQALTFGDNEGAIRLLRKIISVPGNAHEQDARELLGLALERSGQIPRAKFEYKKYLELYKEGAGPTRVQQRLTALENIGGVERRRKLRVAKRGRKIQEFRMFGRLSQDYSVRLLEQKNDDDDEEEDTILGLTSVSERASTHASVRGRYRTENRIVQGVVIASYYNDLRDSERTDERLSDLYIDWDELRWGLKAVLGRQRARSSGIFDRYDGGDISYQIVDGVKAHYLKGENVFFYDVGYGKTFDATRWELGSRKSKLNGNVYAIAQKIEEGTDREAVGGDFRYSTKEHSFFGGADYDTYFSHVNSFNLRWGWQFIEKSRLNISYDFRKYVLLSNALSNLYGGDDNSLQRTLTYDEMVAIFTEERLKELALNRSAESTSITIGNTYQMDKKRQLNVDLSVFRSEAMEPFVFTDAENEKTAEEMGLAPYDASSPGVAYATRGSPLRDHTGYEGTTSYNFTTQFIANDVFAERDLHVVGFRFSKFSDTYHDYVIFWNGRLSPFYNWNPRPRLTLGYRDSRGDGQFVTVDRYQISPSIKVDRRWKKQWVFEVEMGYDGFFYAEGDTAPNDSEHVLFRVGFHYTF